MMISPWMIIGVSVSLLIMQQFCKGMTFVFCVSRPTFFENQCGSVEKTNKPPKNKHGTSQRKCETVVVKKHSPLVSSAPLMKPSSLPTGPTSHSAAKKKTRTKKRQRTSRSPLPALELFRDRSPSLQAGERVLTGIANERAQESDWGMVGSQAHFSNSVEVKVLPIKSTQITSFGNSPPRYVPESTMMSPSAAPVLQ